MNISLFVTSTMFLGYLISGFFTVYHAVNEKWYITYKDFYDCKSLPLSVILIQVINVCIMIYLIVYNIFKCVCKTLTNTKSNIAFSCGSVMFFLSVISIYIYGFYVLVNKECFAHYKEKYPNLDICLEVALLVKLCIILVFMFGCIFTCVRKKIKKKEHNKVLPDKAKLLD